MGDRALRRATINRAVRLYGEIQRYIEDEGFSPGIPELTVLADMSSKSVVWNYLRLLREWGWITWEPKAVRTIRLTRPTERIIEMPKPVRKAKKRHVA